ncbi:MAG: hypothetical protein CVU39_18605 [Chloroflexi bacterium HGW-Chloroflexi-10]|nr:MAG: hypothetical protein CVU39_18605 [Chloroflexi bacterium HGW-Chloroflexi-10]
MINNIEAILFDMGGTLRGSRKSTESEKQNAIVGIMKIAGVEASPVEFASLLNQRAYNYKKWAEETFIELTEEELWTKWMLPDCLEPLVHQHAIELNQLYRDSINRRTVFPETKEVVINLFRRGYRLGLVSNTTSSVEVPAALKELNISGCFETVILSAVIGKRKPDPSILLEAIQRMGVSAEKCVYIGDRVERDVYAAKKAGFAMTIIIADPANPEGQLVKDPSLAPDYFVNNLTDLLNIFPVLSKNYLKPKYNAAFSTMWAIKNFPALADFFESSRRLGFAAVELNHLVNSAMLEHADMSVMPISSIHEPCPADISAEALKEKDYLISSTNEEFRIKGVHSIKRSIDIAKRFGASLIVIHAGHVQPQKHHENLLRSMIAAGTDSTAEYKTIRDGMIKLRSELAVPHFESVKKSVRELLDYAIPLGIRLGIEVRYHFMEIPSPDELEILLNMATPEQIGFIYDVGHAQTLDRLGFYPHQEWLDRFASRIIETHMHDVLGTTDHLAPGMGEVDFDMVARYLPLNAIRTCEFQEFNTVEQVKSGLNYLLEKGCIFPV